jgi:hypothetical protein
MGKRKTNDVVSLSRKFIEAARWRRCFTPPGRYYPHSYTLRTWHEAAGTVDAFDRMVGAIAEHGYDEMFGKRVIRYWRVDDHRYWMVGSVLNRCTVDERGRPDRGPKWLREGRPVDPAQMRMEVDR